MNTQTGTLSLAARRISRRSFKPRRLVNAYLDPLIIVVSLFLVALARGDELGAQHILLAVLAFALSFPGEARLHESWRRMLWGMAWNLSMLAGLLLVFGYASGYLAVFSEGFVWQWLVVLPFTTIGTHALVRHFMPKLLASEAYQSKVVIAGCNDIGANLAANFDQDPMLGIRFHGFFDDRSRERLEGVGNNKLLGKLDALVDYVKRHQIDHIYLALPMASQPRILKLLDTLKDTTVSIYFVPDIFVTDIIQGRMDTINGIPVVSVCETPFTGLNGLVKRASDIVLSSIILTLIAPILLFVAAGVRLSSPGPVIFAQRRYGLDGREIVVYKFRSMTVTEDGDKTYKQVTRGDARVTRFGAFIRKTSLDELPQFINVLQGRMSIVGPRPHAVAVNEQYRRLISGYMIRHKVKPGITGWAQVNGYRGGDDLEHMKKRIEFDLEYLRNWSLSLDLKIILRTVGVMANDATAY